MPVDMFQSRSLNSFKGRSEKKYSDFTDCLMNMSTNLCDDPVDGSFYDYTKRWTEKVNRGGLFETTDQAFVLFRAIEINLQSVLQTCLQKSAIAIDDDVDYKQQIVTHVVSNEEVLFHWSISSVYIMDECASAELLKKIVELWLTIRGFSMAKQWMEQYKHNSHISTVKAKGLRQTLKLSKSSK